MTKEGLKKPNYWGSVTQASTCRIGNFRGEEAYTPFSSLLPLVHPNDIVWGGWDISSLDLAEAMERAQVGHLVVQKTCSVCFCSAVVCQLLGVRKIVMGEFCTKILSNTTSFLFARLRSQTYGSDEASCLPRVGCEVASFGFWTRSSGPVLSQGGDSHRVTLPPAAGAGLRAAAAARPVHEGHGSAAGHL